MSTPLYPLGKEKATTLIYSSVTTFCSKTHALEFHCKLCLREAAKKSSFFSGPATKSGRVGPATKEKGTFFLIKKNS